MTADLNLDLPRLSAPALCAQVDPDLFFAVNQGDPCTSARKICEQCDARVQCLEDALTMHVHGIWGGLSQRERQALQVERGIQPRTLTIVDSDIDDNPDLNVNCPTCGVQFHHLGITNHQRRCPGKAA